MGLVWAVRRSLRLLTLLTLMASALCTGQSLAAQEHAAPRVTLADSARHQPSPVLVAHDVFEGESALTIASAADAIDTAWLPVPPATVAPSGAPVARAPLPRVFSPSAGRAPPRA